MKAAMGWIDVEIFSLDEPAGRLSELWALLSADERERASRFRFEKDRDRFVVGRGRLRETLGPCLEAEPARLEFGYGMSGKPFLLAPAGAARLSFNLAHSDDTAVLAVSDGRRVGVDIEALRAWPPHEEIARAAFSEAERAALDEVPRALKARAFYHSWTRKEACLKALGCGFSGEADLFEVTVDPRVPARIVAVRGRREGGAAWTLLDLPAGKRFAAALVFEGAAPRIQFVDGGRGNAIISTRITSREQ